MVVQVAAGMMAGCLPAGSCAARIMLFAGGPPTVGSGKVVDMELTEPIRYIVQHTTHYTVQYAAFHVSILCNPYVCWILCTSSAVCHVCLQDVFY